MNGSSCEACGHRFEQEEPREPCPECGSEARLITRHFTAEVRVLASVDTKLRRPGFKGLVQRRIGREKVSRGGKLARETQVYDRSATDKTIKIHHVEELNQEDGGWEIVHDTNEEFPAKRRPGSDSE